MTAWYSSFEWLPSLSVLPPMVTALLALVLGVTWQAVGVKCLWPLVERKPWVEGWKIIAAWLLWPVVTGALAMLIAILGIATKCLFLGASAVAVIAAMILGRNISISKMISPTTWGINAEKISLLLKAGLLWQALFCLFAFHPQRLYDQLNYHLVVAKNLLEKGGPFQGNFDTHLFMTGFFEFSLAWPRSWIGDDLFNVAMGQGMAYLLLVPPLIFMLLLTLTDLTTSPIISAAAFFLVPAILPDNEFSHIAKPEALLMSWTAFALLSPGPWSFASLAFVVMIGISLKFTFVHTAISLFMAFLLVDYKSMNFAKWPMLGNGAVGVFYAFKNYFFTGLMVYPFAALVFPTPLADGLTLDYWHKIAFPIGGRTLWDLINVLLLPLRKVEFSLLALTALFVLFIGKKSHRPFNKKLAVFCLASCLLWPLFFNGEIYTRFVAPYLIGLFLLMWTLLIRTSNHWVWIMVMILSLSGSHLDVMVRKMTRWNLIAAKEAFARDFEAIYVAEFVNSFSNPGDIVISQDPAKYFYRGRVLHDILSPLEREEWTRILNGEHSFKAAIITGPIESTEGHAGQVDSYLRVMKENLPRDIKTKSFGLITVYHNDGKPITLSYGS